MKRLVLSLFLLVSAISLLCACGSKTTEGVSITTKEEATTTTVVEESNPYLKSIKILAIGNSFSVDSMEYLYQILTDLGCEQVVLGNMFIAGCSLATHGNNAYRDAAAYEYYKNNNGTWRTTTEATLTDGIIDEKWDYIVMQQVSGLSGVASSYDNGYEYVLNKINEVKTNPDCKLAWNMTWAYQKGSNHPDFPTYQNDQDIMYEQIVSAVKKKIVPKEEIEAIIPVGTAVQNVRSGFIGDTITRDTYHLSLVTGRYIAGVTWAASLAGLDIADLKYVPNSTEITSEILREIKRCVNASLVKPFEVTYLD